MVYGSQFHEHHHLGSYWVECGLSIDNLPTPNSVLSLYQMMDSNKLNKILFVLFPCFFFFFCQTRETEIVRTVLMKYQHRTTRDGRALLNAEKCFSLGTLSLSLLLLLTPYISNVSVSKNHMLHTHIYFLTPSTLSLGLALLTC
jgi:hypothetical protein